MHDALLVALEREGAIVTRALRAHGDRAAIEISGMGPVRARLAAQRQVAAGAGALFSVGFAGALRAPVRLGDIVLPREVIDATGNRFTVDTFVHERLNRALSSRFDLRYGALCSVARVVCEPANKHELAEELDADAVDMESAAIGCVARNAGLPFAVLRVVCDGPSQRVPVCATHAVDARGRVIGARLATGLALRPWELFGLISLGVGTTRAAQTLRRAMQTVFDDVRG
ncbi:MAG: adenosylhomocysteine nucleosidase [Gammaproteobacteria bacterium]|jgi:adenosylhomocysteine nucleosidase